MLYLISQKGLKTFKIGYTESFKARRRAYNTCMGSELQVIEIIEGTMADEKNWHLTLEAMGFQNVNGKKEWYTLPKGLKKEKLLQNGFKAFEIYQTSL